MGMQRYYLPPVLHVQPLTIIRRVKRLPRPGSIMVRLTQKVKSLDVLAECEGEPRHVFLDLALGLGVPRDQVSRYLVREIGTRIEEGEIIAVREGIGRRTVRAPGDGRIAAFARGRVLFRMAGKTIRLRAGMPGVVVETDGIREVLIETVGALVQASWGNGGQDYGVMRVVGDDPARPLHLGDMNINLRGAILVGGFCNEEQVLKQAIDISVRGLILGSMPAHLIPLVETLPYPVILTEGFGERAMNEIAYNLLTTSAGREVSIDARPVESFRYHKPEVIIPLAASNRANMPEAVINLEPGVRVRIVRTPLAGAVGVIEEIMKHTITYPSGVRATSARVNLADNRSHTVPLANLEVYQ